MGCLEPTAENLSRRYFLRLGGLSLLGMNLQQYLRASAATSAGAGKAQACILLWLEGGPSQIDTWDPKPSSSFRPIGTNVPGIQISELFPKVAQHMDKLTVIRSVHTEENNHPQATHYALTGHRPNPAMRFPSVGSIISKELGTRNEVPAHVMSPDIGNDEHFLENFSGAFAGAEYDAMALPDPSRSDFEVPDLTLPKSMTAERVADRRGFLDVVDRLYRRKMQTSESVSMDRYTEQALKMVLSPTVKEAFNISAEPAKVQDAYGRDPFGQSVLLARRLVEAGSRFVTAAGYKYNIWDTHNDNDKRHRDELCPVLDRTLSVLLEDLVQRGLYESTIVIAMGEFGRGPDVNAKAGRDHWPQCWSMVMGGGGLRGGQVIGKSDKTGGYVEDRQVTMGDIFATVYKAFGIDWEKTYMSPIGRPIKIANSIEDKTGIPIKEIV